MRFGGTHFPRDVDFQRFSSPLAKGIALQGLETSTFQLRSYHFQTGLHHFKLKTF